MLVSSLPTTLPTLLSLAAASGAASRNGLGGVRADAGAQPPLVVVGAGVLGRLAAQEWQELHPGGCEVLGVTRTRPDEEREAAMRAEGITHRYRSDIEASVRSGTPTYPNPNLNPNPSPSPSPSPSQVRCGTRWPYVLFSASPSGNDDYAATVASALAYWDKDAPGGRFVFTSSAGVCAEQDGGVVTETSPAVLTRTSRGLPTACTGSRVPAVLEA